MGSHDTEGTEGQRESRVQINRRTRAVIGAAVEVHRNLGAGFSEAIYERALCWELTSRLIPFRRQVPIQVRYKHSLVGRGQIDLLVDERLVVELKSVEALAPLHTAQLLSYLKATGLPVGLLINFNVRSLRDGLRRLILTP